MNLKAFDNKLNKPYPSNFDLSKSSYQDFFHSVFWDPLRVHSVVDIDLKTKPSYETLKTVSSPVEFVSFSKKNNKVQITLKGKTGLPSYIVRDYYIMSNKTKIIIPELRLGE